jgi:hypothetical protein
VHHTYIAKCGHKQTTLFQVPRQQNQEFVKPVRKLQRNEEGRHQRSTNASKNLQERRGEERKREEEERRKKKEERRKKKNKRQPATTITIRRPPTRMVCGRKKSCLLAAVALTRVSLRGFRYLQSFSAISKRLIRLVGATFCTSSLCRERERVQERERWGYMRKGEHTKSDENTTQ